MSENRKKIKDIGSKIFKKIFYSDYVQTRLEDAKRESVRRLYQSYRNKKKKK